MFNPTDSRIARILARYVSFCCLLAVAFGLVTLAGWTFHVQFLKSLVSGQVTVKANTGVCFVLLGVALWLVQRERTPGNSPRALEAQFLSVVVSVVGLLSFLEFWKGWNLGIDQILFRAGAEDLAGSVRPGLMSPITAIDFFLLGASVILLKSARRWVEAILQILAAVAGIASIAGILDFVLDPGKGHVHIAPPTAFVLFLFSFAVLLSRKEFGFGALVVSPTSGGELARRILPTAFIVPVFIGWLRWRGQIAGLYSEWGGLVIMVLTGVALLSGITVWTGFVIDRADRDRQRAEQESCGAALYTRSLIEASLDPLVTISKDGTITDVNWATERATGIKREVLIGSDFCDYFTDSEKARHGYQQVFAEGLVYDYPLAIRHTSGKVMDVLYNATIFRNAAGEIDGVFAAARDVTERKRAEEAQRRSVMELKEAQRIAHLGVCTVDLKSGNVAWSEEMYRMFGLDASLPPPPHPQSHLFTPDSWKRLSAEMDKTTNTGSSHELELETVRADGSHGWMLVRGEAVRDGRGEITGLRAVALDTTERKRAEEALRENESRYRNLSENLPQMIFVKDRNSRYVSCNRSFAESLGITPEEFVGKCDYDFFSRELADKYRADDKKVMDSGISTEIEEEYVRAGKSVIVQTVKTALRDDKGNVAGLLGIFWDITERKRAQEQLREASLYTRSLIEASLDPLVTISQDGKITDVNQATEDVTGLSRQQLVGSDFSNYFTEPEQARRGYQQVFANGFVHDYPLALRHSSGRITDVLYNASVFRDDKGEIKGVFAAARDVTERKRAEAEVRRLNDELEQRVIERTAQLQAANQELEAFTYSVSHDLRAPLRHISGFSKMLSEEYGASLPEEGRHQLQRIEEGTRRMGLLVDDLLNLARVGRRDLDLRVTGLRSVVDEAMAELKPELQNRKIEWKIGDLPFVECDPGLMKQVFQNLLSNAVKFTGPRAHAIIELGQQQRDGGSVLYVGDNGVGFNMKYADKLFGVFQRLHRSEDFEGTGVGLATVQRIIQKHGGRIWVEAEIDKGATFYFTLAASEKREARAAAAGQKA